VKRRAASGLAKRDPWRAAFFSVLVLGILAGAAWALLGSSLLVVRHVQVRGGGLVPAAEVIAKAAIRPGTPLATVDTASVADRIEQIAPVLWATVTRSWPDTIIITVRDRTPALAVARPGGFELVDGSGVTVRWAAHRPAGMPLLSQPPPVLRGSPEVRAAVTVLLGLPHDLRVLVRSVLAPTAGTVTLRLRGGVTVRWGGTGQARVKAAELAVLLRTHALYYDVSDPAVAVTQR
jgi:cell division protein FtsQ